MKGDFQMETQVFTKVADWPVIGGGEMITTPGKVGDWYVTPLDQWESTIPPHALQELDRFLKSGVAFKGFLVAEDMREFELRQKAKVKAPKVDSEELYKALGVVFAILGAVAWVGVQLILLLFHLDPLLLCVLEEDDQWLLLAEW